MPERLQFGVGHAAVVHAAFTDRTDGDMARGVDPQRLESRRSSVAPYRWTWLEQTHGHDVVVVEEPGGAAGSVADAAVTRCPEAVLSVQVADCAPVLMFSAVRDGAVVGIDTFGASAPYQKLYAAYGITAEHVVAEARRVIGR